MEDKYKKILLKVPKHVLDFLQVHKFVMGLRETIKPLVEKGRCKTLNATVMLVLVLEDGKRTTQGVDQRFSWTRTAQSACQSVRTSSVPCSKDTRGVHTIKIISCTKRKVFAMTQRAYKVLYSLHRRGRKPCVRDYVKIVWGYTILAHVLRNQGSMSR